MPSQNNSTEIRLLEVIAAYLDAVAAGQAPDREKLLAAHPDLAGELRAFFADHDKMTQAAAPVRDALADPASAETFPQLFGDYELLEELGRGGMGVVYKARQISLNRVVALKRIRAGQLASPEEVARFRREAEAAAGLDHPNIVPIYEVGECTGQHYFTMKLIEGGNLNAHLARFADATPTAELMIKIARAVHHAHQRGILHRDLKPGNILIDAEGTPHVSDFGLAQSIEKEAKLTQSGAILGTPEFMAPEQARGEKGLTTAADVYGLGAICYVLLTGRPPFQGDYNWETLKKVVEEEPVSPRSINRNANRDLAAIGLMCLEKLPGKRYGSAEALATDLQRWLEGKPILPRPPSRLGRVWKWVKRSPTRAALTLATALSAILAIWLVVELGARRAAQDDAEKLQAKLDAEEIARLALKELDLQRQWTSLSHQVVSQRLAGKRWDAQATLKELAGLQREHPEIGNADFLQLEATRVALMPGIRKVSELTFQRLDYAELSEDGSRVLILGARPTSDKPNSGHIHGAWVYFVTDKKLVMHKESKKSGSMMGAFASDKVILAVKGSKNKVFVWDPAANRDVSVSEAEKDVYETWARIEKIAAPYSRPGDALWTTKDGTIEGKPILKRGAVEFWDVPNKVLLSTFANVFSESLRHDALYDIRCYTSLSNNGRWFACGTMNGKVEIWDTLQGKVANLIGNPIDRPRPICFRPDDRVLALHCSRAEDDVVELWDLHNLQRLETIPNPIRGTRNDKEWKDRGPRIRWSGDGTRFIAVASHSPENTFAVYDFVQANPTYSSDRVNYAIQFSRDGTKLVANGSHWSVHGSSAQRLLRPAFKSQGDRVCVTADGGVFEVDIPQPFIHRQFVGQRTNAPIKIVQVAPDKRVWLLPRPARTRMVTWHEICCGAVDRIPWKFTDVELNQGWQARHTDRAYATVDACLRVGLALQGAPPYAMLGIEASIRKIGDHKDSGPGVGLGEIGAREVGDRGVAVRYFGVSPEGRHACVLYQELDSEFGTTRLEVWRLDPDRARLVWHLPFPNSEPNQRYSTGIYIKALNGENWLQGYQTKPIHFLDDSRRFWFGDGFDFRALNVYDVATREGLAWSYIRWSGQLPGGKLPTTSELKTKSVPYLYHIDPGGEKWEFHVGSARRAFRGDGKTAAIGSHDGEIFLQPNLVKDLARHLKARSMPGWDVADPLRSPWLEWTGDKAYNRARELSLVRLQGHRGPVQALAFSADHSKLASAGADFTLCLWDLKTHRLFLKWHGHNAETTAIAWHPDGKSFVTTYADGTLRLWNLELLRKELDSLGVDK